MNSEPLSIQAFDLNLSGVRYAHPNAMPALALHGWLDNAGSFAHLAPLVKSLDWHCLDLAGHGESDHRAHHAHYHMLDYVMDNLLALSQFNFEQCVLVGHSLGGAISALMAGTVPDCAKALILIDGLGPLTTPAEHTPQQLRLFLDTLTAYQTKQAQRPKTKPSGLSSFEEALEARSASFPISKEGARPIVERGTLQNNERHHWRADKKLRMPSPVQLTELQVLAFLKAIDMPVLLIRPESGFPFQPEIVEPRLAAIRDLTIQTIPGQHHVHLDTPVPVAELIDSFIQARL